MAQKKGEFAAKMKKTRGKGDGTEGFVPDNKPMDDQIELATEEVEEKEPAAVTAVEDQPKKVEVEPETEAPKRRRGRPKKKTEPDSQVNIRVPKSVLERLDAVLPVVYGGNLTTYINRLIEKDLEENYEKYLNIL